MQNIGDETRGAKLVDDIKHHEEEDLVRVLAEQKYQMPYVNMANVTIEADALRNIPEPECRELEVGAFKIVGKNLHIGIRTPENTKILELRDRLKASGFTPYFYMVSKTSLEKVWDRFKELSLAHVSHGGTIDISGETLLSLGARIHLLSDIKTEVARALEESSSHRVSRIVEIMLAGGISLGASDIHIEPDEKEVRIRYRLDGVLQDTFEITPELYHSFNSRLKLVSGLKLTNQSMAQDGRFSIMMDDAEINMRVSTVPGAYGESFVMRILNPKSIQVKLEQMGIPDNLFAVIERDIKRPNGLILLTGPTGSGKTTTLYAFLSKIYSPDIKIITIEDPIEYHLKGITQTQTDHEKGYGFLEGLRAALRQDPDVIMVGEIRDAETAKIAVESALTGHLVFSTLHTNNAAGVIPRLIDLEVNPKILTSALSLSIAQRLARTLCKECKKEKQADEKESALIATIIEFAQKTNKKLETYGVPLTAPYTIWEAVGCEQCNFTGYKGRVGIFEAIGMDEAIEKIIADNPSEREIKHAAEGQAMLTMREDGLVKILKGITSLSEVGDVVDLFEE